MKDIELKRRLMKSDFAQFNRKEEADVGTDKPAPPLEKPWDKEADLTCRKQAGM